jgi:predicted YcjX-like family ATPase
MFSKLSVKGKYRMKNEPNLNIFPFFANIIKRNKSSLTKQKCLMTNYPQHDKIVVRTFHKNNFFLITRIACR